MAEERRRFSSTMDLAPPPPTRPLLQGGWKGFWSREQRARGEGARGREQGARGWEQGERDEGARGREQGGRELGARGAGSNIP